MEGVWPAWRQLNLTGDWNQTCKTGHLLLADVQISFDNTRYRQHAEKLHSPKKLSLIFFNFQIMIFLAFISFTQFKIQYVNQFSYHKIKATIVTI